MFMRPNYVLMMVADDLVPNMYQAISNHSADLYWNILILL